MFSSSNLTGKIGNVLFCVVLATFSTLMLSKATAQQANLSFSPAHTGSNSSLNQSNSEEASPLEQLNSAHSGALAVSPYATSQDLPGTQTSGAALMPPENDECTSVSVTPIAPNSSVTFTGSTVDASPEVDGPTSDNVPVVWEAFSISEYCSSVVIEACGSESILSVAYIQLFKSCSNIPVSYTSINWDECGDGNFTIYFDNLYPGDYYYPIVGDYVSDGGATVVSGNYEVTVSTSTTAGCSQSPAPECLTANTTTISPGETVEITGTTIGVEIDPEFPNFPLNESFPVVWEAIELTGACSDLTLNYCGTSPQQYSVYGILYTNCPTEGEYEVVANESYVGSGCPDQDFDGPTIQFINLEPGIYYYAVAGLSPANYQITASVSSCYIPPNDDCFEAVTEVLVLDVPSYFEGNTENATPDPLLNDEIPTVWHSFEVEEACSALRISYCGNEPQFPAVWALITTDCLDVGGDIIYSDSLNWITCDIEGNNPYIWFFDLSPGQYYYPVGGESITEDYTVEQGPYSIEITAFSCTPDCNGDYGGTAYNDECDICVGGDTGEEPCAVSDCPGDFNNDGVINISDLLQLLSGFGCTEGCGTDLNDDSIVNSGDLLIFLTFLGNSC